MANSKILEQKQMIIDEIKDRVNSSKSVVLFDYHGVTDADIKDLRTKLREAGADFKVYKNTLMNTDFQANYNNLPNNKEGLILQKMSIVQNIPYKYQYQQHFIKKMLLVSKNINQIEKG